MAPDATVEEMILALELLIAANPEAGAAAPRSGDGALIGNVGDDVLSGAPSTPEQLARRRGQAIRKTPLKMTGWTRGNPRVPKRRNTVWVGR